MKQSLNFISGWTGTTFLCSKDLNNYFQAEKKNHFVEHFSVGYKTFLKCITVKFLAVSIFATPVND